MRPLRRAWRRVPPEVLELLKRAAAESRHDAEFSCPRVGKEACDRCVAMDVLRALVSR